MPALRPFPPHPADVVPGILCPKGHFNHRLWRHCARCGSTLLNRAVDTTFGSRPVVGNLVRDDGLRHPLCSGFLLTSRSHLDAPARVWVGCVDWTAYALTRSDGIGWQPDPHSPLQLLAPDTPVVLHAGGHLQVGMDRFRFVPVAGPVSGDPAPPPPARLHRRHRRQARLPGHTTFLRRNFP